VRNLIWLGVIIGLLIAGTGAGVLFSGAGWAPKLALDLQGGTQIVLTPKVNDAAVTEEQLKQAVAIIRQRVDASGVSEAEINTQGSNNVVVSIPGTPDKATLERIEASAKLDFRPVLVTSGPTNEVVNADGTTSTLDPARSIPTSPTRPRCPRQTVRIPTG
jgi:preprotein translocase subunit SecD